MTEHFGQSAAAIAASPEKAERLIARAQRAWEREKLNLSYSLFGQAIEILHKEWVATHNLSVGERLVFAYEKGSFPALRKAHVSKRKHVADRWSKHADERGRMAISLHHHIYLAGGCRTELNIFALLVLMSNRSIRLLDRFADHDAAYRLVLEANVISQRQWKELRVPPHYTLVSGCIEALCLEHWCDYEGARRTADKTFTDIETWSSNKPDVQDGIWFQRLEALRLRVSAKPTLH